MAEAEIKGLVELEKFMQTLPVNLEKNVMRSSMRAGAKLLMVKAKQKAPVGPANAENKKLYGGYAGALRDSIRVGTDAKFGKIRAYVRAGGKNKKSGADVYYAHIIEWGAKAHPIKATKGGFLRIGNFFAKAVWHPGIKARAFMRPTLDMYWTQAVNQTALKMRATLEKKHGLTTPAPRAEGDV